MLIVPNKTFMINIILYVLVVSVVMLSIILLSVAIFYCYAEYRYAESHYAECGYVECRYPECHYAECRGATLANEGKSATSFCRQMPAFIQAMFYNFYLVKNHKIADNSATT
jgi:hypothetical protein